MCKLISIIVPFYNVESYITECLDSVFRQDLPSDSYEVICVNDGSTDGSRVIVERYMTEHQNLRLIDHPYNINLGSARNTGIKAAIGKYIWHVDSDDYIAPNCLKSIVDVCDERNVDVLEFGYIGANNISKLLNEPPRTAEILSGQEYLQHYYFDNFGAISPIWRRVYRRAFLLENHITSPSINMGEDNAYAIQVFALAQRVSFVSENWYFYRVNYHSLVGENKSAWTACKWYEASMTCAKSIHVVFRQLENLLSPDIRKRICDMITYNILMYNVYQSFMSNEIQKEYWKLCRRAFYENTFVFRYLGKRKTLCYIWRILFA